jgi:ABC-type multidrug transport system fused ATPase/permease subunit
MKAPRSFPTERMENWRCNSRRCVLHRSAYMLPLLRRKLGFNRPQSHPSAGRMHHWRPDVPTRHVSVKSLLGSGKISHCGLLQSGGCISRGSVRSPGASACLWPPSIENIFKNATRKLMTFAIETDRLSVTYRGSVRPALKDISVFARAGSRICLMGPDGAGKSTFCLCLNGVIPHIYRAAHSGRILVRGRDPMTTPVNEMASLSGLVLQEFDAGLLTPSVEQELAFGLENLRVPRAAGLKRIDDYLRLLGLDKRRTSPPGDPLRRPAPTACDRRSPNYATAGCDLR